MPELKKHRSRVSFLAVLLVSVISIFTVFSSEAEAAFRFVSWGDAKNVAKRLPQTAKQAVNLNPNLTIFNCDLENDGSTLAGLTTMTGAMGSLFGKTFLVRGNHDTHIAGSTIVWQNFQNTAAKAQLLGVGEYSEINASLTYSFDYDNTRFIAVDVPGNVTVISQAQLNWIDSRLTDAETSHPNLIHAFIFFHGPIYCVASNHCSCSSASNSSCTPSSLVSLINRHPIISATFHGHEHILGWTHFSSSRLSAITHEIEQFITSPAGGWTYNSYLFPARVDYYDTGSAQGYASIDINGNTFTVNFYRVGNTNPVWTRSFTKTGIPSVTIFPTTTTYPPTSTPSMLRTFYIATNGNDSNPGTLSSPWRTIGKGVSSITAGDTLYIRGGTYNEVVNISRSGNNSSPIIIDNYQNEIVIINGNYTIPSGTWSPLVNISGSYVVFRDIEVTRSNGEGVQVTGNNSKIINIYTHHNHEAGAILKGNDTVADGCRVYYNSMHNEFGSQLSGGGGWGTGISAARNPSRAVIRNTVSWNNWGEGISTFGADHTILEDNISYDNWSVNMYIQNVQYALVQRNLIYRTPNNIFSSIANKDSERGLVENK